MSFIEKINWSAKILCIIAVITLFQSAAFFILALIFDSSEFMKIASVISCFTIILSFLSVVGELVSRMFFKDRR